MKKKTVGILTWHYYLNFGSALQSYALKTAVERQGYRACIINYHQPRHGRPDARKERCRLLLSYLFSHRGMAFGHHITYPFLRFQHDYLRLGRVIMDEEGLRRAALKCETVVCGSDQIWAPSAYNPTYLLDFVPDSVRRISYAASIGLNDIPDELTAEYRRWLSRFAAVSVRETQGQQLLADRCGISSSVVLDPTLLIPEEHWHQLERRPTDLPVNLDQPFLFCYFLNSHHSYEPAVRRFAKKEHLPVVGYSLRREDSAWMYNGAQFIGPREFLWLIAHAEGVVTDSYHCTIFSLLAHQRFITLQRFRPDDAVCQNSRINQLVEYFSIGDAVFSVNEETELTAFRTDDVIFEQQLTALRENSEQYLKMSLKGTTIDA